MSHLIRFGVSSQARSKLLGLLLLVVGLLHASPAWGSYLLTLDISDNLGHSTTVTTGPFTGAGNNTFADLGAIFPEFSSLSIAATSDQTATQSFLNKVDVSGSVVAANAPSPITLTVKLTGSGFTMPGPVVNATQGLSSSSLGTFASAQLTGTIDGTTVANQTIGAPGAVGDVKNGIAVASTYDAVLLQHINDIANTDGNKFNATSNVTWTSAATPEPGSLTLFAGLFFGLGGSALYRSRKARQAGA